MSKIQTLQLVFLLIYSPHKVGSPLPCGLTYSEVFVELSLDTVPWWVLSEKRKKVEAFSCPTEGSICLKGSLE